MDRGIKVWWEKESGLENDVTLEGKLLEKKAMETKAKCSDTLIKH